MPQAGARLGSPSEWIDIALVVLVTLVAFLPGIFGHFVGWDDDKNFIYNPAYRGFGWRQLSWMFTTSHMGPYAPLTWVTLGADYVLWGMNALGYHLTSLVVHACSAGLFVVIARRLLRLALPASVDASAVRLGAAAAAMFFAVHPLRVESVVWITERRDVVSGLFFLLAVLAYLRAVDSGAQVGMARTAGYWGSFGCFTAALLAKSIVVTLPLVLLILDAYPLRRLGGATGWNGSAARRVYAEKVPFLVLSGAASAVAFVALAHLRNMPSLDAYGPVQRLAISAYGLAFYLGKTILPIRLSPLYELPIRVDPLAWRFLASAAVVLTLTAAAWTFRHRWPSLPAAWCFYVVSLLPVLGIFQNGPQIAADRYTYLSCMGLAVMVGGGVAECAAWRKAGARRPLLGASALTVAAVGLVVLVGATARQTLVWHDSVSLWNHALSVDPASPRAHTGLAGGLLEEGRPAPEIATHLEEALRLDPRLPEALMGLGVIKNLEGSGDEAVRLARQAVALRAHDAGFRYQLGEILRVSGHGEAAIIEYMEAARLDPGWPTSRFSAAVTLASLGRNREALVMLEEAKRLARAYDPSDPESERFAALTYGRSDAKRALAAWDRYLAAMARVPEPSPTQLNRMVRALITVEDLRKHQTSEVSAR